MSLSATTWAVCVCGVQTPGPSAYDVPNWRIYLGRPPIYSVTGKNYPPDGMTQIPGPGAHENEKVRHT